MTLWIATTHQAVRLTIHLMKMRKPQSPTIQSLMTMMKAETAPSAARMKIDSTVAEMHLSSINSYLIVNKISNNTNLVLITYINYYMMLTY